MTPRQKIFLLIQQFHNGDLPFSDFCNEYFPLFELECYPNDLTFDQWTMCKQLSHAIERFSPFEKDVERYPDLYCNEEEINSLVRVIYEEIRPELPLF